MRLEVITRKPASAERRTPILFVHGMWHAAWCWKEYFLPYFAEHGYLCHAVSLRGHGGSEGRERLRWTSMADYVDDVDQVVNQIGTSPILVGHSMGGMVVQSYLESHEASAAVLLAPAPPNGVFITAVRYFSRHPVSFLKANLTLRMFPVVSTPSLVRDAFFSQDIPQEELRKYSSLMQDDSYRAYLDMICLDLPHPKRIRTPILVLGAANDTIFSPAQIAAAARAYDTEAEMFPNMAHDMMLEPGRQAVADRILTWLGEKGL